MIIKKQNFHSFSQKNTKSKFTDWLKLRSFENWDKMINHRFTKDIAAGTLSDNVFKRYLHLEYSFVRSAITIFSYALAKAPSLDDQDRLVAILYALVNDQEKYFKETFNSLGIKDLDVTRIKLKGKAALLRDGAIGIAETCSFIEILSAMLAAEWMYLTWCRKAAVGNSTGLMKSWIILHITNDFSEQVNWIINRVNELGMSASFDVQEACAKHFGNMLEWEIAFHDAPYETP